MPAYGFYPWTPDYGYRYVHPASRLHFEDVEPLGKVFELLAEQPDADDEGGWLLLRHDDHTYKVRPDLFSALRGPARQLPFGFGDPVRERTAAAGQPAARSGTVGSISWDAAADQPRYSLWFGKRRGERTYSVAELLPA